MTSLIRIFDTGFEVSLTVNNFQIELSNKELHLIEGVLHVLVSHQACSFNGSKLLTTSKLNHLLFQRVYNLFRITLVLVCQLGDSLKLHRYATNLSRDFLFCLLFLVEDFLL